MKNNDLEKYISDLSPELQEKARECKDMDELNELLAENDVELSDDALEAVAGGCSYSSQKFDQGDPVGGCNCPACGNTLYYWDMLYEHPDFKLRMYCNNSACSSYNNHMWYVVTDSGGGTYSTNVQRY